MEHFWGERSEMKPQSNSTNDCCSADGAAFKREIRNGGEGGVMKSPQKDVGVCVGEWFCST